MPNLPGGCTTAEQFSNYVYESVRECIMRFMSKEATARHLQDRYQISPGCTETAWRNIEKNNQVFFRTYFENGAPNATALAKMAKQTALDQIKEKTGACKTPNLPPKAVHQTRSREKEQQRMEFVRKLLSRVPEEAANPNTPAEFLKKLLTTLGQIESNTDHMAKLMSDGHGFAAHSSAVGSSKRQREDEQGKERGDNDKAEKPQDQNIQLPQPPHGQSRGNKAAKNTLDD